MELEYVDEMRRTIKLEGKSWLLSVIYTVSAHYWPKHQSGHVMDGARCMMGRPFMADDFRFRAEAFRDVLKSVMSPADSVLIS